jgi:hypothetical protein
MTTVYNGNWRVCSARKCHNRIEMQPGERITGPAFCCADCEADYRTQNPNYAPTISGLEITEQLEEFNEVPY